MTEFSFHRHRSATPFSSASTSTSSLNGLSRSGPSAFMPSSFFDCEDADSEKPNSPEMDRADYNYVRWQSSQTGCQALNQLIDSSKSDSETLRARSTWQREPSFDQIPGFSLLSTVDVPASSTAFDYPLLAPKPKHNALASTSAGPSSSRQPSRSRPSEVRSRPHSSSSAGPRKDITNAPQSVPPPLPFFDKGNPEKFLHILKGVAKRVDENAGLRPRTRKSISSASIVEGESSSIAGHTAHKRSRVQSLGGKAPESIKDVKRRKSHLEATEADESNNHMHEERVAIDGDNTNSETIVPPMTPSQVQMPPPALPVYDQSEHNVTQEGGISGSSTSVTSKQGVPRHLDSNVIPSEPTRAPKLHPLLQQQSIGRTIASSTSTATSSHRPQPNTGIAPHPNNRNSSSRSHQARVQFQNEANPQSHLSQGLADVNAQTLSLTSVPVASVYPSETSALSETKAHPASISVEPTSTPSPYTSRPPPLGMRRTHTYPSSMQQKVGQLPTKQKGFKPPLLTASQPQAPSQSTQVQPWFKTEKGSATGGAGVPIAAGVSSKQPPLLLRASASRSSPSSATIPLPADVIVSSLSNKQRIPETSVTPGTTAAPRHLYQSVSAAVNSAPTVPPGRALPNVASHVPIVPHSEVPAHSPYSLKGTTPPPPDPLPGPTDGDPDSSFGDLDMSFDMDALEETMRLYD